MDIFRVRSTHFLGAFAFLVAARLFFSFIDFCSGVLGWRIFARRFAIRKLVAYLVENKFPMRKYRFDDALTYLFRLRDGSDTPNISAETRGAARELEGGLATLSEIGAVRGWRAESAFRAALDIYAPREKAQFNDLNEARTQTA
jgi:hypothetical protein